MYIVFLIGSGDHMGKKFGSSAAEAAAMGRYIQDNLRKGITARVELFI